MGLKHRRLQTPSRDLERRGFNFGGSNFHLNQFRSRLHRLRLEGWRWPPHQAVSPIGETTPPNYNDGKPCGAKEHWSLRVMWSSPKLEIPELNVNRARDASLHPNPCTTVAVRVGASPRWSVFGSGRVEVDCVGRQTSVDECAHSPGSVTTRCGPRPCTLNRSLDRLPTRLWDSG